VTKAEASEILAQQSFVFRHGKNARVVNLILQGLSAVFLGLVCWLAVVAATEGSDGFFLVLGAIPLIFLIGLGMYGVYRPKSVWRERVHITQEGIQKINPSSGDMTLEWKEVEAIRFSKINRGLLIISGKYEQPLLVDSNLEIWRLAVALSHAMAEKPAKVE